MTDPSSGNGFYTNRPMMALACGHKVDWPGHPKGPLRFECAVCHRREVRVWNGAAWEVTEL